MSSELTSFIYRLEPRPDQARVLLGYAGATRWIWNHMLNYREESYLAAKSAGGKLEPGQFNYVANAKYLTKLRQSLPWLAANNCEIQQQTLRNQDKAFSSFFKGVAGFPKFKSRRDRQSFRFAAIEDRWVKGDKIRLPGVGWVRFRQSRSLVGEIRNVTISLDADRWSISFCLKGDFKTTNAGADPIGLDLGVTQSVTIDTGEVIHFPVQSFQETRKVRFLQRKISRQKKSSVRRCFTIGRLSKLRHHISNRVKDCQHKVSTRIAATHKLVALDGLRINGMTKADKSVPAKSSLNRSMLANGHARFQAMLKYKCTRSGAQLVEVDPAFTSQRCNQCNHVTIENRKSQAVFKCVVCEHQDNADVNAAKNILAAGLAVSARGGTGISLADESRNRGGIVA